MTPSPSPAIANEQPRILLKERAAAHAVSLVHDHAVVGLGSGSTAAIAISLLGRRYTSGELPHIRCVATSRKTEALARRARLPLTLFTDETTLDMTLDGADAVDPALNMIKGGGGALLREKIVAQASKQVIIMVDDSKLVDQLGATRPVPVEVYWFGLASQAAFIAGLGGVPRLRREDAADRVFVTDQGNPILDCDFGAIANPGALARRLDGRAGIAGHGLFVSQVSMVIVAEAQGAHIHTRVLEPPSPTH